MSDEIELSELGPELARLIEQIGDEIMRAAPGAMQSALDYVQQNVPEYPGGDPPAGQLSRTTPKARRYFFAAVKEGKIPGWQWKDGHPEGRYKQSGHLGQSITTDVMRDGNTIIGSIGTNAPYAAWVIGPDYPGENIRGRQMYQASMHAGRWWKLDEVVRTNSASAWEVFSQELFANVGV